MLSIDVWAGANVTGYRKKGPEPHISDVDKIPARMAEVFRTPRIENKSG